MTEAREQRPAFATDPYRRTFVGRETEFAQLQAAFDAATRGEGGVVMLSGEPGIGKTALCEQFATYVSKRGGRTLVGHSYEESSLSLPYLAFVEAMRAYVLTCDPEGLKADLGAGAAEVARIVPEVRDRVQVDLREAGDPEEDRWRLRQSVTSFLRHAASVQPLVVVLEDLHWANPGTLDLLLHVVRSLEGARLLIVGTYRDEEVARTHPLSLNLAELRRAGNFLRVPLRGLTVDEVRRMYVEIRGQDVAWGQVELVHQQTEGNPLFVQEVLRFLVEEGIVALQPGGGLPDGLREVVGRRFAHLGERAYRTLAMASVIGREFRLDVLQKVARISDEELLGALEEAQQRAIIEPHEAAGAVGFRFTHAFFRETLYEDIFVPRRVRLHQQVGLALEEIYTRRLEEHAPELAEHFIKSTDRIDLDKAVRYGELAARRAIAVFDYGEAARHLEQSLRSLDIVDSNDDSRRCDLLLLLGEALLLIGEREKVIAEVAPAALSLAQRLSDDPRAYAACKLGLDSTMPVLQKARYWLDTGEHYAGDDPVARIRLARARAVDFMFQGRGVEAKALLLNALALARNMGSTEWEFATLWGLLGITDLSLDDRTRLVNEYHSRSREGVTARNLSTALWNMTAVHLAQGDRKKADELASQMDALYRQARQSQAASELKCTHCLLAALDGRLEEADPAAFDVAWAPWAIALAHWRGIARPPPTSGEESLIDRIVTAAAAALDGDPGVAADLIDSIKGALPHDFAEHAHVAFVSVLMEAATQVEDRELCEHLYLRLRERDLGTPISNFVTRPQQRVMGDAATFLGRHDEARSYYEEALATCERIGHRPELAIVHAQLAGLLKDCFPDEHEAAIKHLGIAVSEFEAMNMQQALKGAHALRSRVAHAVTERPTYPAGLSVREVEVLRLVAAGRSNAQIANELVISLNTVQRHVSSILAKTRTASRTEAAAYAHGQNLIEPYSTG